jgi:hypothetical protein
MGSTAKRNAKQSARATAPAASRPRARAPIRAPGRSTARTPKKAVAPARATPTSTPAKTRPRPAPFPLRAVLEQLEPRLLMSADLMPLAADALFAAPAPAGGAEFRSLTDAGRSSAVTADGVAPIQRTHEVVFVDPRVPDRNQLLAGLAGQATDGRSFEVIVLDPARDGIAQVTAALADRIQVDAVHFITHGTDGAVQLGRTWLDAKTVSANADAIAGWGNALKADADLLFYGCDLAATARGRALVEWIAELTRADVAASTDATGGAPAGGDWELEAKVGAVETAAAVDDRTAGSWAHALGAAPAGFETRANVALPPTQNAAAVATAPDGRFVAAWVSDGQDGGGKGVYARLYDAAGAAQTGEFLANTTTPNDQMQPAVAMDGAGNFVVVWSGSGAGDGAGVFARRFDAAGNALGAEFRVNGAVTAGTQSDPDIAMETNGDFAVAWQSDETGSKEIWLQRYQADGTPIVAASLVSVSGNDDFDPSIAMDDDGDFAVAWQGPDGSNAGVLVRRYSNAGVAQGAPAVANATTSGDQLRPDVAMDADGDYVVVWDREGATDADGVYGRRFSAAGAAQGADFRVNTVIADTQDRAAVAMSGDGRFVVTWDSKNQDDGSTLGVYRQEYTAAGAPDGSEFGVNTTTTNDQTLSAVAMDDSGSYVVAWSGEGPGDTNGVFWQRFTTAVPATITGTIYHDVDGDGNLAGASMFAGATVRLFRDVGPAGIDASDALTLQTLTDPAGTYSFSGMALGTYYVVVDSSTLTSGAAYNAGFDPTWVWAEQTYGAAGSALGAGFTAGPGALYGGRSAIVSDNAAAANPVGSEHVVQVNYIVGTGIANVDFGFSFNAVVNTIDDAAGAPGSRTVQGSLRQFIQNANAIQNTSFGIQSSNFSIGGGGQQSIGLVAALPAITDAVTLDAATQEGFTGTPLIELSGATAGAVSGLTLSGTGGSTVRGFVINRFTGGGIVVSTNSNGNQILNNWIGTSATGAAASGNTGDGISLRSNGNLVSGNVISGNLGDGIEIEANRSNNRITANYIGINAAGTGAIPNSGMGVNVSGNTNTIGGTVGGEGNVISGNGFAGIQISTASATGNVVQGNLIGTNAAGTLPVGNGIGVLISGGATGNQIGGTGLNAGNTIAFNSQDGVQVTGAATTGNTISGNAFRQNTQQGIDLVGGAGETVAGVTPNDGAGDVDAGPNGYQNYPQLLAAGINGGNLDVRFGFASTASRTFRIELFASNAPDASGFGEGQRYLGSFTVLTDGSGFATSTGASIVAAVAAGEFITATATDLTSGNTSEFSNAVVAGDRIISGTIRNDVNGNANVTDDAGAVFGNAVNAVSLYLDDGDAGIDAGDLFLGTTSTDNAGFYSFSGLGNATYWVVVDSRTLGPANVWAEQTYAVVGAASGAGFTTLPGALYGGRDPLLSDNAATLTTAEHVTRAIVAGTNVTDINSGFSFTAVTTARDGDDDAGSVDRSIQGSLRQFIQNSNTLPGVQTVEFAIGAPGSTQTINVTGTALPAITDAVILDAWTQGTAGYSGPPLIELDGSSAGAGAHGLAITAGGSTVRGFVINDFQARGISIVGGGGNTIANNYIGTDASGMLDRGNGFSGIFIDNSAGNTIGGATPAQGNVISGNALDGVSINGAGSTGNVIAGNLIGLNAAGTAAIANGEAGVDIDTGARNNTVGAIGVTVSNVISGNLHSGIEIDDAGTTGNLVIGNYIGLNAAGDTAIANARSGVTVTNASGNTIGGAAAGAGNVISGNNWDGVALVSANGNVVQSNYVGTDWTGDFAVANLEDGIYVLDGANNLIGGTGGAGNLLSGNLMNGLEFRGAATDNVAQGNYVGVNANGDTALGNGVSGVMLDGASGNTIGGAVAGAGNLLSGNVQDGITGFAASDNLIQGNFIGTDAGGDFAIANGEDGIYLQDGSDNTIGGSSLLAGNLISGNQRTGVTLWGVGSGSVVQGNYIGTDAFGTAALGNGEAGVYLGTTGGATIGGVAPGAGNLIAFNGFSVPGWDGVAIVAGTGHAVLGNSIHSNFEQAIDINDDGITANDGGDPDSGTNELQNFPVVASAVTTGAQVVIVGTLNSTPGTNFRVEFFANSGDGEGETYLDFVNVTTDASGNAPLNVTLPVTLGAGEFVTASATRADATFTSFFETSELGPSAAVVVANQLSGTLRHDVNANSSIADDGGAVFANAVNAVSLYLDDGDNAIDGGDFFVGTASTDAGGNYLFTNLGTGTYWVVADSKALGGPNVWAEQTYGAAGAAQGAGFSAGGALYGGRNATLSDDATALVTAEHVVRRNLAAGSAAGVDFGFSFNAVTNTLGGDTADHDLSNPRTIQGSLRQFIQNANANATFDASMRFVPAVATNDAGGGGSWWQIVVTEALPAITRAGTKIDGTAYSSADGVTIVNPNAGFLGTGGTVGVDNLALSQVARPELELQDGLGGTSSGNGLDIDAADVAVRNLAIWGFWNPLAMQSGDIVVDTNVGGGAVIENNAIGVTAGGADPGAERSARHGVAAGTGVASPDGGTVRNNLIAYHGLAGIDLRGVIGNAATGWWIEGNEIRGNGLVNNQYDGINVVTNVTGLTVRGNLVENNQGAGIDLFNGISATVVNNTVRNNSAAGGPEQFQIGVGDPAATGVTIDRNVVGGSFGPGVDVSTTAAGSNVYGGYVQITRNSIFANGGLGIDLDNSLFAPYDGDGVTPNDAGDADGGPNDRQNFPVLTGASVNGGTVTINGSFNGAASTTFRVEFFASATGDASGYGEGQRYLGMAMVSTDPSGNATFSVPLAAAVGIGETVTATATSLATNGTSEFAQNVTASAPRSISGMTRHDLDGNGLADDGVAFFTGGTVYLYRDDGDGVIDAGDVPVTSTTVQLDGTYTFTGLTEATYYVAIDSKTLLFPASEIWAEQTYGVAGAASGAGFLGAAGALFGGRDAAVSDDASTLTTSEHVTRVVLSGADAAGVDAGFALNAITSNRDGDDDGALSGRTVQGSLRQFIQNSELIGGTQSANFSIGGGGFQSIALASALPEIYGTVVLDATTQEGFSGTPLIELDGSGVATFNDGLEIYASDSTVRGFIINRFQADGIHLEGSNNIVAGNWIGLDATGAIALGNGAPGVDVVGANNLIGGLGPNDRNVIAGNGGDGIRIQSPSTGTLVQGNFIGTDRTGTFDLGSAGDGIHIAGGASGNTIGGSAPLARNVIAGNDGDGIEITGNGNTVAGNYIGLDATGGVALANGEQGIDVSGANNAIGGTGPFDRNVISGNASHGVMLAGGGATANRVIGNYIGTDLNGTLDLGNADGVRIQNGAHGNTIGGTTAAERNVISGNEDGIEIRNAVSTPNIVAGNYIGTTAGGAGPLGNSESGIEVTSANNTIGGTAPGAGNTIAFNGQDGVMVDNLTTTGVAILGNVIHSNTGTGIDLADNGPTPNDGGDVDSGPNNLQNFPVLTGAATNGTTVTIAGSLDSTASTNYRIEFFATGVGGPRFLGALSPNLFVGAAGSAAFVATLTTPVAVTETITATATNLTTNSTSELSAAVTAAATASISGALFHDVNGNAVIGDDGAGAFFAGALSAVALYLDDGDGAIDSGDSFVTAVDTNGSGQYTLNGLASGTYYVVVNSKALSADPVWAEQTYAVIGAANNAAGTTFTTTPGALYGGRNPNASDNALGSINTAEHVTRVTLLGASVNDINSGFSFTAITSSRDGDDDASGRTVQGSLRQFIQNANVLTGTQTADFSINYAGGGGPQSIALTAALPTITQAIILDATSQEGFAGTPIIELNGAGAGGSADGLTITAGASTVSGFAINRFGRDGISISVAGGNTIAGNFIGTNAAGTADAGNGRFGIRLASGSNVVDGTTAAGRNVISGNNLDGIYVTASGNVIRGNYIGTDRTGTSAIGNSEDGIWLDNASNTMIGGTAAGAGNVISGNGWSGIGFSNGGSVNVVHGNLIGVNATNTGPLGNSRHGIDVAGSFGTTIGGLAAGQANVIAHNNWDGVALTSGTGHTVSGNSIHSNGDLGIDIGNNGVTPNDPPALLDGDSGTNNLQNFPVLTAVSQSSVSGTLDSRASRQFRIELFASPTSDGEGQRFLGSTLATTNASGFVSFTVPVTLALGEWVTATATDTPATGDTSELSAAIQVNSAPVNNVPAGPLSVNEDAPLALNTISVSDFESNVGSVVLTVLNGALAVTPAGTALVAGGGTASVTITGNQTDINLTLGSLLYQGNLNYSGPETLTVTSTDAGGAQDVDAVAITVNPVDDVPEIDDAITSLAENSAPATAVYDVYETFTGTDSDRDGQALTYSITAGNTGGAFTIDPATGVITVANPAALDFETTPVFNLTVQATDGATPDTAVITVNLVNLNDNAPQIDDATAAALPENSPFGTAVYNVNEAFTGTDLDRDGQTLAYSITAGNTGGAFAIDPATGAITVANPVALDFETNPVFTLTVNATDGTLSDTAQITVSVVDVNEPPVLVANAGLTVNEGTGATITAAQLAVADPDNGAPQLVYTVGTAPANGTLYLSGVPVLAGGTFTQDDLDSGRVTYVHDDSETVADSLTFTVSDGAGGAIGSTTFSITVNPVNDVPLAAPDAAATNENTAVTTADVLLNDALGDQPTAIAAFDAASAQGGTVAPGAGNTFLYTPAVGFSGVDSFTYTIEDADGEISTATVTVTVANVANDAPVNIVPGAQISAEDATLVFSLGTGNLIAVSDPDAGVNPLEVTLTAAQGTLTLAATAGLTFTVGDGAADATMTFTGTLADINAALDGMSFVPPLDYSGPASVTITTGDLGSTGAGGPQSDSDIVDITVVVVDDSPVLDLDANNSSGALGADYVRTFTEGGGSVRIADFDATLTDNDSANLAWLTVTITNLLDVGDEILTADTTGTSITWSYVPGTGVLTLNGADTVANYQQVLRTIRYENLSDAPSLAQRVIEFVASDGGSVSNTGTTTVTIAAVNDAPSATIAAASYTATENVTLTLHGTGLSVADIDALPSSIVDVYLSSISGLVGAIQGDSGVTITGSGSPTLTLTGTIAQVNALLAGTTTGTVTYSVGSDSPAPTDTLDLAIDDRGATGSGGAQWGWDSVTVNLIAVNDAPLITSPGTVSTFEDTPLVFSAGGGNQILITDVDAAGAPVELTVNATNGVVTLAGTAGLVFFAGDGTADASMTFQGTVAAINAALDGLVFAPPANYNGSGFLSLIVNDLGNSGLGGPLSDGPDLVTITITPVNDLPSGADNAVSMPQDTTRAFGFADFGFSDGDAGDAMSAVRIDTLSLPPGATLQLSGANVTPGQVIAAAQLGNLVFTPAAGMSGAGYASFTFSVHDTNGPAFDASPNTLTVNVTPVGTPGITVTPTAGLVTTEAGGTAAFSVVLDTQPIADVVITLSSSDATEGTVAPVSLTFTSADWNVAQTVTVTGVADALADGGVLYTIVLDPAASADPGYAGLDPADVSVTNLEANAPPTVTVPPGYAVTEGSFLALAGTGLSVADADAGAASVTVTLSVSAGLLVVSGLPTVTVAGSGTPVVTLTGPVADIDATLAGAGMVNYFVGSDAPPAFDTLTLAINDNHPFDPRTASASVSIAINAVNDAPVNTLPGGSTTLEDTAYVFSAAGGNQISVTDVDAGGATLQVSIAVANGVVTLSAPGLVAFSSGDGTADANMTFTGTLPSINAALNGLVFTPNANYNGLAFIQLTTNDLGASGAGGALTDVDLATIDVLPVNDAPTGTDTTVTLNEDSTYTFNAGNFGFTDVDAVAGDAMTEVRIDSISLPAGATLTLGGTPVTPGTVIPVGAIGTLVFTPVADANGAGYASFTFSVRDTGVPPGPLFDPTPNTMTVNVTPVNDLPIITSDGGGATAGFVVAENTTAVTTATATDIDLQPLAFSLAGVDAGRFSIDSVTGVLTFNPAPNFEVPGDSGGNNVYNVTVVVSDGAGGTDSQALTVTVTDANDAPTAGNDAYVTDEELPLAVAATGVLANDGDEDGTPVTAVLVTGPANGAVAFNADGSFVYAPNANFAGVDTFTYQASDGVLGSALATVSITVNPINDAPSAADGNVTVAAAYAFAVADFNYFDVDGDPLDRIMITALPVEGQLLFDGLAATLNQEVTAAEIAAGRLTYTPPATSSATAASFGFSVSDGALYEAATHTMTIGFASGAVPPPPPPPAPPVITPPPAPPVGPPAPPPAEGAPAEPGGDAPTGGGRGGGGGGGAPAGPPAADGAPAAPAETAQAAAGVVATAAPQVGSAPAGSVGFQSGGVAPNPGAAAPAPPVDQRGEPPVGEVKAEMETVRAMAAPEVRQALDEARERVQEEAKVEARVAGSVFVVSTGLSVGYVLWLLRGGALIASLLSSLPAWRLVDPLPVLGSMGGRAGDEDDDSLEDLVANNDPPSVPGEDALGDNDNVGSVRT